MARNFVLYTVSAEDIYRRNARIFQLRSLRDRLCGPVVNYVLYETASVFQWSEILATEWRCVVFLVRYELNLYMLCRRK
jgi:hypothetical protein